MGSPTKLTPQASSRELREAGDSDIGGRSRAGSRRRGDHAGSDGDYECPYTRLSRHSVHQLQREFSESLRFVFRHFPLEEIHPHARAASVAAEAAARQIDFWTMDEYLFEHQQALEDADLIRYAVELGLDADRFARDRSTAEVQHRVDRDVASGERSGVPGTPTFYVNGIRHAGGYDLESLRSAILAHAGGRAHAHPRNP